MYDFLKDFSVLAGWLFEYGRADFNNLKEASEAEEKLSLFLDPVAIEKKKNDSGVVESLVYSGSFMLLYSSDIDEEGYEERYIKYIKPIVEAEVEKLEDFLNCEKEVSFDFWKIDEVINMFDYNFDGVIVTYKITVEI